jgi:hypothetical protein
LETDDIIHTISVLNFLEIFVSAGGQIDEEIASAVSAVFWKFQSSSIVHNSVLAVVSAVKDPRAIGKIFLPENLKKSAHSIYSCGIVNSLFSKFPDFCESRENWVAAGVGQITRWQKTARKLADVPSTPASSTIGRTIAIDLPAAGSPHSPSGWGAEFAETAEEWTAHWEE